MKCLGWILALAAFAPLPRDGAAPAFGFVDLFVATAQPLAAWQIELQAPAGTIQLVGVEGGDGVFAEPAFYDPAALQHERVIVAAFSTANPGALPQGKVHVARLHVRLEHGTHPEYAVTLGATATVGGARIAAQVSHETGSK